MGHFNSLFDKYEETKDRDYFCNLQNDKSDLSTPMFPLYNVLCCCFFSISNSGK